MQKLFNRHFNLFFSKQSSNISEDFDNISNILNTTFNSPNYKFLGEELQCSHYSVCLC